MLIKEKKRWNLFWICGKRQISSISIWCNKHHERWV